MRQISIKKKKRFLVRKGFDYLLQLWFNFHFFFFSTLIFRGLKLRAFGFFILIKHGLKLNKFLTPLIKKGISEVNSDVLTSLQTVRKLRHIVFTKVFGYFLALRKETNINVNSLIENSSDLFLKDVQQKKERKLFEFQRCAFQWIWPYFFFILCADVFSYFLFSYFSYFNFFKKTLGIKIDDIFFIRKNFKFFFIIWYAVCKKKLFFFKTMFFFYNFFFFNGFFFFLHKSFDCYFLYFSFLLKEEKIERFFILFLEEQEWRELNFLNSVKEEERIKLEEKIKEEERIKLEEKIKEEERIKLEEKIKEEERIKLEEKIKEEERIKLEGKITEEVLFKLEEKTNEVVNIKVEEQPNEVVNIKVEEQPKEEVIINEVKKNKLLEISKEEIKRLENEKKRNQETEILLSNTESFRVKSLIDVDFSLTVFFWNSLFSFFVYSKIIQSQLYYLEDLQIEETNFENTPVFDVSFLFFLAMLKIAPVFTIKPKIIGSVYYDMPFPISYWKRISYGIRWVINLIKKKQRVITVQSVVDALAGSIYDEGISMAKQDDDYYSAILNRHLLKKKIMKR